MSASAKAKSADIIIREATLDDLDSILFVDEQLYAYDGEFDDTLNHGWSRSPQGIEYFSDRISSPKGLALIAECNGHVVGTLIGGVVEALEYRSITHVCELESMFVAESHRRSGLGARLVKRFIDWSREHCGGHVRVEVSAANRDAIRFYRKMGFAEYNVVLEARTGEDGR